MSITFTLGTAAAFLKIVYDEYMKNRQRKKMFETKSYKKELRVLGFPNSGKTQFLNALRNIPNPKEKSQTIGKGGIDDIPMFTFDNNLGLKVDINAKDINGSKEFLTRNAKDFINEADYLLFFCDIISYLQDKNKYRNACNGVLRAVTTLGKSNKSLKIIVILSYEDQLSKMELQPTAAIEKFREIIENTEYGKVQCFTVNTYDQQQVRKTFDKILHL